MGSTKAAAEFGQLPDRLIEVKTGVFSGKRIAFTEALLYRPDVYMHATYSDMIWMAHHILQITESDLRWVVNQTNWPDFMKVAAMRKLLARQANIAEVFGFQEDYARIAQAFQKYAQDYVVQMTITKDASGLPKAEFKGRWGNTVVDKVYSDEASLVKLVASEPKAQSLIGKTFTEKVLSQGVLAPCDVNQHPVQDFMIRAVNTSGFFYRLGRVVDHAPTEEIRGCGVRPPNASDLSRYLAPKS